MPSIHIYSQITRARQAEIAIAAAQRHHGPRASRQTSSVRAPFAIHLLRRSANATS